MADNVEPEVIKQQMNETRAALAEKIETLGHKVSDTVQEATAAVSDTVVTVKDAVGETVESVKDVVAGTTEAVSQTVESVKESLDFTSYVDRYPWLMVGGAVAVGYLAGQLLAPTGPSEWTSSRRQDEPSPDRHRTESQSAERDEARSTEPEQSGEPGFFDTFGKELQQVQQLALGTLFGLLRETITRNVAPALGGQLAGLVDSVTTQLGGKPLARSEQPGANETSNQNGGEHHDRRNSPEMGRSVGSAQRPRPTTVGSDYR